MGSQSVTDFSAARKKRIQSRIQAFDPEAYRAPSQARQAGIAAIGSLAPSSSFVQALTSASADTAAKTLSGLVTSLKGASRSAERTNEILGEFGVSSDDSRPYVTLVAGLRRKLEESLSASSTKTEAAAAAADALSRTLLDIIARRFPEKSEPSDVAREELVKAIRRTPESQFSKVFLTNLINALLRQTFDAAREEVSRERIDELVSRVERVLSDELATRLTQVSEE